MPIPIADQLATTGAHVRPLDTARWRHDHFPFGDSRYDISAPDCCPRGSTRPLKINNKTYAQTIIIIDSRYWVSK